MKGVFYNSKSATCSIHETGRMCYEVLRHSSLYELEYSEEPTMRNDMDFVVFNYHHHVCAWVSSEMLQAFKGPNFAIVTEVELYSGDLTPYTPKIFDHYIILDPTITETETMHAFPRPLIDCELPPHSEKEGTIISTFGLPTDGKRWGSIIDKVIEEYGNDQEKVHIRFHVPPATFVLPSIQDDVKREIADANQRLQHYPHIDFQLTTDPMSSQEEIVRWCANNTINVFLYDRHHHTGLAATTDQAILSGRPLLVSSHPTFRHIHKYIPNSSTIGIKQAIQQTREGVLQMRQDWSAANFRKKFENILMSSPKVK